MTVYESLYVKWLTGQVNHGLGVYVNKKGHHYWQPSGVILGGVISVCVGSLLVESSRPHQVVKHQIGVDH